MSTSPPMGLRRVVRWSEVSLQPRSYWGDRYDDVLYERVDGWLSGFIIGLAVGVVSMLVVMAVVVR